MLTQLPRSQRWYFWHFFSARMALQYFRDEVVLAILPTGIEDLRWSVGLIEWERIKEITLNRRESEFWLKIHLWPEAGISQKHSNCP